MYLDLRIPFGISEHSAELLLNPVLVTKSMSVFHVCRAYGRVILSSGEGNKKLSLPGVLWNVSSRSGGVWDTPVWLLSIRAPKGAA